MKSPFPLRTDPDVGDREPKLVRLDESAADEVFDALGSETARALLLELHAAPRPASELAEAVDTSIQNVQYHLTKLEAADLIAEVDTWYSESGSEMSVYAPADESLVVFAGDDPKGSLRRLLERLVGALAVLAVGAVAVALAFGERSGGQAGGPGVSQPAENASASVAGSGTDPVVLGVAFLGGGLVALAALFVVDRLLR